MTSDHDLAGIRDKLAIDSYGDDVLPFIHSFKHGFDAATEILRGEIAKEKERADENFEGWKDLDEMRKIGEAQLISAQAVIAEMRSALEKIANHKQTSIDKVYLIHQCEGYQTVAREVLAKYEEKK